MLKLREKLTKLAERYNDHDLSWLSFNRRVLAEAIFDDLEVYDKIKFIAIHGSNLDEFARVRLAMLEQMVVNSEGQDKDYYLDILGKARNEVHIQSITSRELLER